MRSSILSRNIKQEGESYDAPTQEELQQFEIVFVAFGPDPELNNPQVTQAYHDWVNPVVDYIAEHFGRKPITYRPDVEDTTHSWVVKYNRWCREKYGVHFAHPKPGEKA